MQEDENTGEVPSTETTETESTNLETPSKIEVSDSIRTDPEPTKLTRHQAIKKSINIQKSKNEESKIPEPITTQATSQGLQPHKGWNKVLKTKFSTWSPEEQKEALEWQESRDKDIQSKFTQWGEKAKTAESWNQIGEDYKDYFEATGGFAPERLQNLVQADIFLDQNPIAALKWLAETKGIKIQIQGDNGQTYPPQLNHETLALRQELSELKKTTQTILEQEQNKFKAQAEAEVESFINATNEAGEPIHPYLHDEELSAEINADMEVIVDKILKAHPKRPIQQVLKEAYTKAVRANDVAWEREQQKATSLKQEELKKKAKAAKTAGSSVRGSPVGSTEFSPQGKARREVIEHLVRNRT
jgi:hypothetical protein